MPEHRESKAPDYTNHALGCLLPCSEDRNETMEGMKAITDPRPFSSVQPSPYLPASRSPSERSVAGFALS